MKTMLAAAALLVASTVAALGAPACDGVTDDTAAINAVLADPSQPVLTLNGGVCVHSAPLVVSTRKQVYGQGATLKFVQSSGSVPIGSLEFAVGSAGTVVRDLVVSHSNGSLGGTCSKGIVYVAESRITMKDVEVNGNLATQSASLFCNGINFAVGITDFTFDGGSVHHVAGYGMLAGASGAGGAVASRVRVTGARITNWRDSSGIRINGIDGTSPGVDWRITDSTFDSTETPGFAEAIGLFGGNSTHLAQGIKVTGNTIRMRQGDVNQVGVQARFIWNADVSGNDIYGGGFGLSIDASQFTYRGNTFNCQTTWGIEFDGDGTIADNQIDGCGLLLTGIGGDGPGYRNTTNITGNQITGVKQQCIQAINNPGSWEVTGNQCRLSTNGTSWRACYYFTNLYRATFTGNRCDGSNVANVMLYWNGIYEGSITGNSAYATTSGGILVQTNGQNIGAGLVIVGNSGQGFGPSPYLSCTVVGGGGYFGVVNYGNTGGTCP